MRWTMWLCVALAVTTVTSASLLDGISGVVSMVQTRGDLADKIRNVEKGRLLLIAFTGKTSHLNKGDIAFFMAIHEALFDKELAADFLVYTGPISDAMASQYSLHSFALPKVMVCQGPGKYHEYTGGKQAIHISRWLKRFRRTETDL